MRQGPDRCPKSDLRWNATLLANQHGEGDTRTEPWDEGQQEDDPKRCGSVTDSGMQISKQPDTQKRPDDGAQGISRPVKSERLASIFSGNGIRQHGVTQRTAHSPSKPGERASHQHQRPPVGQSEKSLGCACQKIAAHRDGFSMPEAIRKPTRSKFSET